MLSETYRKCKNLLIIQEKFSQFPYTDTTSHLTIGYGRNLSNRGIFPEEAAYLLDNDIYYFYSKLSTHLNFFDNLDENRKIVLIDMCFNLGLNGFLQFRKMLEAMEKDDWNTATSELLNSEAAHQCRDRYTQLASIMKTGELNV